MMERCEICWKNPAEYTCNLCGRKVCGRHYNKDHGICSICMISRCEFCGRNLVINRCIICGRYGCRDCLIQVDPSRYLCIDCYRKYGERYREILKGMALKQARKLLALERKIIFQIK